MTDQARLVSLIGQPSDSPDVQTWLQELKAPGPKLKEGDTDAYVSLPLLGMDLVFTDEAFQTRRPDLAIGEGALLLSAIMLKSSEVADYADYNGPLPGGIVFGDAPAEVHRKLGPPESVHDRQPKEFWTLSGLQLTVSYDRPKTKVKQVTLEVPQPK